MSDVRHDHSSGTSLGKSASTMTNDESASRTGYQSASHPSASASQPWLNAVGSRYFLDWLSDQSISLAFTTYQTGKLFFVGRKPDNAISIFERTYNHCMGMYASPDGRTLWVSSRFQLWRFEQAPATVVPYRQPTTVPGAEQFGDAEKQGVPQWTSRGYDVAYIPRVGYTTGHVDMHDVAVDRNGRIIFVNTMFGCLATLSERANFQPLWQPPFLSALVPEDRCHLNGLAMKDGQPAYVTTVSRSDVADGWRDRRHDGGCVIDVRSNEIVCMGLSMPHSPRWYRDQLWVLNSGTGEIGTVDLERRVFQPVAFCPGYLRGLTFVGDHAIVTLSKPRHASFGGLALNDRLQSSDAEPQCGLQIVNLKTGGIDHWLRLEGNLVTELYDSAVLPGVRQPMAVGFKTDEIERLMLIDEPGTL